jgi:hypothetical protein
VCKLAGELRDVLGHRQGALPRLLGQREVLRRPEDERGAVDVHAPQREHLQQRRLPGLPAAQDEQRAEAVGAVLGELEARAAAPTAATA